MQSGNRKAALRPSSGDSALPCRTFSSAMVPVAGDRKMNPFSLRALDPA